MKTKNQKTEKIAEMDDWQLICAVCCPSFKADLPTNIENGVYDAVWAEQDGYGEKGYTPPQGYDWSGIRDSSEAATPRMAKAARDYLASKGRTELTYAQVDFSS